MKTVISVLVCLLIVGCTVHYMAGSCTRAEVVMDGTRQVQEQCR